MNKRLKNNKVVLHLLDFPFVWIAIALLLVAALFAACGHWKGAMSVGGMGVALVVVLLLVRPMNAVYGLMGTTGSIRLFFWTFLLTTLLFALIYHLGFFRSAGITYDVNQPHIDFDIYAAREREPLTVRTLPRRDTVVYERLVGEQLVREEVVQETVESLNYQPIDFWLTWRNTMLTALMQEPPEFFAVASTWNAAMEGVVGADREQELNQQKTVAFQHVLLLQILISWIFFGVFISLLYSKFRYEL